MDKTSTKLQDPNWCRSFLSRLNLKVIVAGDAPFKVETMPDTEVVELTRKTIRFAASIATTLEESFVETH